MTIAIGQQEGDIIVVAEELMDMSEAFIKSSGNFLPHGAIMREDERIDFVAAVPESGEDMTNSEEILPVLHSGLQNQAALTQPRVVAVCESVFIDVGAGMTSAIKVLGEHKSGSCLAIYLPYKKRMLRGIKFGEPIVQEAAPEVPAWRAA